MPICVTSQTYLVLNVCLLALKTRVITHMRYLGPLMARGRVAGCLVAQGPRVKAIALTAVPAMWPHYLLCVYEPYAYIVYCILAVHVLIK